MENQTLALITSFIAMAFVVTAYFVKKKSILSFMRNTLHSVFSNILFFHRSIFCNDWFGGGAISDCYVFCL